MRIAHLHLPGITPFGHVQKIQEALRGKLLNSRSRLRTHQISDNEAHNPTIITFTPSPVFATGRRDLPNRSHPDDPTPSLDQLPKSLRPVKHLLTSSPPVAEFHATRRGGQTTYHGPGQLVAYTILDIKRMGLGSRDHIRLLESTVIDVIRDYGVHGIATRDPGVWTMPPKERYAKYLSNDSSWSSSSTKGSDLLPRKIASVGVHLQQYVSSYGIALNVTQEPMWFFRQIVACGLEGREATSLEGEGVNGVSIDEVAERFIQSFVKRYNAGDPGRSRRPRIEGVYQFDMQDLHPKLSIIPSYTPVSVDRASMGMPETRTPGTVPRVQSDPGTPAEIQRQLDQQVPAGDTNVLRKYAANRRAERRGGRRKRVRAAAHKTRQSRDQQAQSGMIIRKHLVRGRLEPGSGESKIRKVSGSIPLPGTKEDMWLRAPFEGSILRSQLPRVFLSRAGDQQAQSDMTKVRKYKAYEPMEQLRTVGVFQGTKADMTKIRTYSAYVPVEQIGNVEGVGLQGTEADMKLRAPYPGSRSILRSQPSMELQSRATQSSSDEAALQESLAFPWESIAPGDPTSIPEEPSQRPKRIGGRVNRSSTRGLRTPTVRRVRAGSSPPSIQAVAESGGRSRLRYADREFIVRKYPGHIKARKIGS
jgi:lipoyl(octanoyl) transferase